MILFNFCTSTYNNVLSEVAEESLLLWELVRFSNQGGFGFRLENLAFHGQS